MLRTAAVICALLTPLIDADARGQSSNAGVPVEVVATASEYVPRSTTVSHPGHSYTDCLGSTSYFGQFHSYGDFGSVSGTADTNTHCSTTFSPPTETTLTTYRKVNYTIAKGEQALYLLSCTQTWRPTASERVRIGIIGALDGGSGRDSGAADRATANAKGTWSECPAFGIGTRYTLTVNNTSDARLESTVGDKSAAGKPVKLEYLNSVALPAAEPHAAAPPQRRAATATERAVVHITSSLSGAEIYIDGKFFGNTPSDITLPVGEHVVRVAIGGKAWSRSLQITAGEIRLHAQMPDEAAVPSDTSARPVPAPEKVGTGTSETLGTISVTSGPTGAEVYVDDLFSGHAPMTLKLKPGRHAIRIFMRGYKNWSRWVTVEAGSKLDFAATMERSN